MDENVDSDKEETIFHGTTKGVAYVIVGAIKFKVQESFFASDKSLA